jgi:hypothetical protein
MQTPPAPAAGQGWEGEVGAGKGPSMPGPGKLGAGPLLHGAGLQNSVQRQPKLRQSGTPIGHVHASAQAHVYVTGLLG